ncbi:MAG: tetratricopeptide repeat protein [Planctomycetaceae bacterium]
MNGMRFPFRDTFAAMDFRKSDSTPASDGELSPEFREAQKVFKKDPEGSLLAWARWQEDVGEYGEARKKYRELLVAYPDNIEAKLGLARIELSCGRVKQAEDILTELAHQRPTNAPVRLELGRLYTQQEDWQKAIAAFEAASAIDRENQVCRYELGVAFARCHRYDQALSHLTYAVGESGANYNIGYVLHEQGNDAEAAEWFQNALQTHPDPRTAEKTNAMLAQMSPKKPQDRGFEPTYPSASPSTQAVAARSKQATIDQFEPASFDAPSIRAASRIRTQASGQVLPYVSSEEISQPESHSSMPLPPVSLQSAHHGIATPLIPSTANGDAGNPFRTVSHTVPQEPAEPPTTSGHQLPQWRGASRPATLTQGQDIAPAKWRGRE